MRNSIGGGGEHKSDWEEEEENIYQIVLVKTEAGCEHVNYRSWRRPTCQNCHRTCAHLIRVLGLGWVKEEEEKNEEEVPGIRKLRHCVCRVFIFVHIFLKIAFIFFF